MFLIIGVYLMKKLKPSDIKTLEDINKIPILTRNQVKNNLPSLVAKNIPKIRDYLEIQVVQQVLRCIFRR